MIPRQRVTSIRCPAKPSNAGNRVIDAIIVIATVVAAPIPRPEMNSRPINNMPSNEITTVTPANTTARPAVSIALTVASSNDWPFFRFSRAQYGDTLDRVDLNKVVGHHRLHGSVVDALVSAEHDRPGLATCTLLWEELRHHIKPGRALRRRDLERARIRRTDDHVTAAITK